MQPKVTPISAARTGANPQATDTKAPNKYGRKLTREFRAIVAEECRIYGSQQTAKRWNLAVSLVIEFRCEALQTMLDRVMRTVEQQRAEMARLERRAA